MQHGSLRLIILLLIASMFACKREEGGGGAMVTLGVPLHFAVDSCCVQAPNVFTPNGDGIDDVFRVICTNVSAYHMELRNASNQIVLTTSDERTVWNGHDPNVAGNDPTIPSCKRISCK